VLSHKAKLASAFVRLGLLPDGGSTHRLQRLVGRGRAYELMATGRALDAEEALLWGVANRVVPHAEVVEYTRDWAEELARGPRRTLGRIKQLLDENASVDLSTALDNEAQAQAQALKDCEFKEGFKAHLARRDPDFLAC
jgi:2-(1,2-epoxy-1,2-dihydrophenyl)acetyl-CoA isomerase